MTQAVLGEINSLGGFELSLENVTA